VGGVVDEFEQSGRRGAGTAGVAVGGWWVEPARLRVRALDWRGRACDGDIGVGVG
jgi:hypothetical protein